VCVKTGHKGVGSGGRYPDVSGPGDARPIPDLSAFVRYSRDAQALGFPIRSLGGLIRLVSATHGNVRQGPALRDGCFATLSSHRVSATMPVHATIHARFRFRCPRHDRSRKRMASAGSRTVFPKCRFRVVLSQGARTKEQHIGRGVFYKGKNTGRVTFRV